jgi:hypothetical protein
MSAIFKLKSMLSGICAAHRDFARDMANYRQRKLVAVPPYHDDIYVVSFPKSGATWMDFLMANLHLRYSGSQKQVTFFNIHQIIPDINLSPHVRPECLSFPACRVFKSHSDFNPYYNHVIYVVRDPRDVMVSYYHFMKGIGQFSGSLSEMLRSREFGVHAWCKHVDGWFKQSSPSTRMWLIRYEDLKADPQKTVKALYEQIGYELSDDLLAQAIEASSFTNMKRLEAEYGYGGRELARNFKFMRKGAAGGWKDDLSADDVEFIGRVARTSMNAFGYT